jgi:excisionase family DNA binding protein
LEGSNEMEPTNEPIATNTSHVTNSPKPTYLYATVDEYAERLQVSRGTVFAWVREGMPSFKVGRTRRIVIERADRWLEAGGADRSRKSTRAKRPATAGRPPQIDTKSSQL